MNKFTNNARSSLAVALAPDGVNITLLPTDGARFPTLSAEGDYFLCTLIRADGTGREIVKATARVGDILTVTRAQEGTAAGDFPAGTYIALQATAATYNKVYELDGKVIQYAPTKAAADTLAAGLGDGATIIVDRDETRGGVQARYTVASSLPVFVYAEVMARSLLVNSPSYQMGAKYSEIDPDVISAWTFDGAQSFANKLGINNINPVTGTWTPDAGYVAGQANYSAIMGGYDNVANGLASIIASMHSIVYSAADHGTIIGGSVHGIEKGSYCSIYGGTNNRVTALKNDGVTVSAATNAHILGGRDNRATSSNATIVGGQSQIVDGEYASAIGGSTNRALGNFDHVAGSNNETRRGTLGAGQRNTIGGGRFNIVDSATNPVSNTISGGEDNEAYGSFNAIGGGDNNTIGQVATSAGYGTIGGGLDNSISAGSAGTVAGGRSNSVTVDYGTVFGGRENLSSGQYATAGGYQAVARHDYGFSYGASRFAANGDAQCSVVARKVATTNDTPTAMLIIVLPDDSTFVFSALIVARRIDADNESGGYKIEGVIDRNAGAGTTTLVGSPVITTIAEDTAAFEVSAVANKSGGGLQIVVTGESGKTIRWVAKVDLAEVTG